MAMTLQAWTRGLNKGTMDVMRVDNSNSGQHDHGFGLGAHEPEQHDVSLGAEQLGHEAGTEHGLFDSLGHGAGTEHGLFDSLGHGAEATAAALGGHVEVGLHHDFGHDGLHEGLDGLHDSVHHSVGLGFGGDEHHSLHEGLHEGLHETLHDTQHDLAHDPQHDVQHDVQHHDTGLGDLFHH
ncbi:MAG: hypothetical protein QOI95_1407 [Acidimicrobiaceae bacterium]